MVEVLYKTEVMKFPITVYFRFCFDVVNIYSGNNMCNILEHIEDH